MFLRNLGMHLKDYTVQHLYVYTPISDGTWLVGATLRDRILLGDGGGGGGKPLATTLIIFSPCLQHHSKH
jgi:hypothetical protein